MRTHLILRIFILTILVGKGSYAQNQQNSFEYKGINYTVETVKNEKGNGSYLTISLMDMDSTVAKFLLSQLR